MLNSYAEQVLAPATTALVGAAPKGVVDADHTPCSIVPVETFEALQRAASRLPKQLALWRRVMAASAPVADLAALVRATLDATAAVVASEGDDASLVAVAATTLVACCAAHTPCFDAWIGRHKHALRGSAAVLAYLAANPAACAPLRAPRATAIRFAGTLNSLRGRHQQQLAAGKGWQGAAAARAEAACTALLGSTAGGTASQPGALILCLLLLVLPALAVLVRHDARLRHLAAQWLGPNVLPAVDAAFDATVHWLASHMQRAWVLVQPHVQRVWMLVQPHVRRLLVLAGPTIGWPHA